MHLLTRICLLLLVLLSMEPRVGDTSNSLSWLLLKTIAFSVRETSLKRHYQRLKLALVLESTQSSWRMWTAQHRPCSVIDSQTSRTQSRLTRTRRCQPMWLPFVCKLGVRTTSKRWHYLEVLGIQKSLPHWPRQRAKVKFRPSWLSQAIGLLESMDTRTTREMFVVSASLQLRTVDQWSEYD